MKNQETDQYLPAPLTHKSPVPSQQQEHRSFTHLTLPRWHSLWIGYLSAPLLVTIALLTHFALQRFGFGAYTATTGFYLVTTIIAWQWGIGPAIASTLLGYAALEYFVTPPDSAFGVGSWNDIALDLPFLLTQLLIILITFQRQKAEYKVRAQAQTLILSNQELERANQLKDLFFSQVSHELKNPLTTIRGQAQLDLRRLTHSQHADTELPFLRPSLEKIDTQTTRLQALIDDLLDVSSLRSGKFQIHPSLFDLNNLCQEVAADQQTLANRSIVLQLLPEPIILHADYQRLTQVLINLVSNALKYSPDDTPVLIQATQDPSYALLTIHNAGPAISLEKQSLLFEPFYRTPEAAHSPVTGWGLGLSITKEIVEQHGGLIWVSSSSEEGTTFFVQLPLDKTNVYDPSSCQQAT